MALKVDLLAATGIRVSDDPSHDLGETYGDEFALYQYRCGKSGKHSTPFRDAWIAQECTYVCCRSNDAMLQEDVSRSHRIHQAHLCIMNCLYHSVP